MSKLKIYLPILFALILMLGIFLGFNLHSSQQSQVFNMGNSWINSKVANTIEYLQNNYVDSIDIQKIEESAIKKALEDLDPHSQYITAEEFSAYNDPLKGNFEGIGVMFRIEKDTIMIINVIGGGPSEKVGLMGGDRIITIDGDSVAGKKITNDEVISKLKGERGSKVKVEIFRRGIEETLDFTITRDVIPTYSVDIAFIPQDSIGYIKLSKFSATSYHEVVKALTQLQSEGLNQLILDLRGNTGGYLQAAINLSDLFLEDETLIVYTEGRNRQKQYAYATNKGLFENGEIIVLIDEGSASASEIVAGAIQDNDRGTIIGRRSFGKGLVQEQMQFNDGSAIRLTVSRYYTPTGRCIQKSYSNGTDEYNHDIYDRYAHGEMTNADSIHFDESLIFTTPEGDTVYGGGGIMPDIFVSIEEETEAGLIGDILQKGVFYRYTFEYVDKNRKKLAHYNNAHHFIETFEVDQDLFDSFIADATKHGVKVENPIDHDTRKEIDLILKALIGRNLFDNEGFYPVYLQRDAIFQKAISILKSKK